ncbi:hypothetical protein N6G02_14845 [Cupriavidus gilardii]|uniref:hypothetical protein n=1 Tax=Cupriavidus gilardii TaxID=82541 RepID=UPI0021BE213C|nr:hypothetical protein [Cupriavidus gilardii]MCT9117411.1 hypothetical protein [Cupriavidus gilardii]
MNAAIFALRQGLAVMAVCGVTMVGGRAHAQPVESGPMTVAGTLVVNGPVTVQGPVEVDGRVRVRGPVTGQWFETDDGPSMRGAPQRTFNGPLTVHGPLRVQGDLIVNGPLEAAGPIRAARIRADGPARQRQYGEDRRGYPPPYQQGHPEQPYDGRGYDGYGYGR